MDNKQTQGQVDSKCSLLVDDAGVLLHANQRFIEISGYDQQQFIGKGINQLFIDIVWPQSQKVQNYKEQLPFSLLLADKRIISVPLSIDMQDRNNYLVQFDINMENQQLELDKPYKNQSVNILSYAKIGLWHLDLASNKPQWSDTVYEIHEVDTDIEVTLETAINFYHEEHKDKIQQVIKEATVKKSGWDEELMIKTAKGNLRWVRAVGLPIFDSSNQLSGFHGIFQDITEQINRQEAQKMMTKRLELAMHASNVGVWELDLITGCLVWDERMFGLYGVKKKDFSGHYIDWKNTVHPDDLKVADATLKHCAENKLKFDTTFRIVWSSGEIRVIRAFADIIMRNGVPIQMIGVNWDITDIREKELKLEKVARVDDLTQLSNRFSFNEIAEKILHNAKKLNRLFAFLFIDADNFKNINDYYGHHVGDAFLKEFSSRLQSACRDRDLAFRLGGDEFAIITDFLDNGSDAGEIANRINKAISEPFVICGEKISSSCSIGIAVFPYAANSRNEMMKNADFALYKSKKEGKNQFNYFTPELDLKAKRELYIKTNLLKAAQEKRLFMNYQPIINFSTKKAFAIESLARWRSQLGFITPDEFIPAAEKSNAICEIGYALIETTIQEYANSKLNSHLSINVSSKQLALDEDFLQKLSNTVKQHQISPKKIILEITESCIIRDINFIKGKLEDLAQKGFTIAIDDFGTGYSSLSLLANLPFKYLKIDKSFIFNSSTTNGFKVLQCIYNVARSLDTEVIAEGVETIEQAQLLHKMGVTLMQGYYFAKPQDLNQLVTTIK